ncbi:MAG: hypothetical protein HY821_11030 [Acidobacteria bacterium]|nr:hypothetical protein [Acidobacteriota bacterium]
MLRLLALLVSLGLMASAQKPVYWLLWFDTEDFVEPASDDVALELARGLTQRGVRATFKVVGEKARVLEQRGRGDVVQALSAHDIGYHTNFHSVHPAPAEYLSQMGLLDGAAEFARRERAGFDDVERIFHVTPSCFGQPGNSWAPQANLALREWGVRVYMDDAGQVGLNQRPFWFGGMLYVFNLGPHTVRAGLDDASKLEDAKRRFDAAIASARQQDGVVQTYYHPTEWAATKFWDAVNFSHGANPERESWQRPPLRTEESRRQAYRIFFDFVDHARATPGVRIVTSRDLPALFEPRDQAAPVATARHLAESIDTRDGFSAADQLLTLLGLPPQHVDGPLRRVASTDARTEIPRALFERAKADAAAFVRKTGRLPDQVWTGAQAISLPDFAATLAADSGAGLVKVRAGRLDIERYIGRDAQKLYNWVIHPEGFAPESLLEMARLQAWTLKPARLAASRTATRGE